MDDSGPTSRVGDWPFAQTIPLCGSVKNDKSCELSKGHDPPHVAGEWDADGRLKGVIEWED